MTGIMLHDANFNLTFSNEVLFTHSGSKSIHVSGAHFQQKKRIIQIYEPFPNQ